MPDDLREFLNVAASGNASSCRDNLEPVAGSECVKCRGLPDDPHAEMEGAFGYDAETDELTEREIDALFVEEMERRDREAQRAGSPDNATPGPAEHRPANTRRGQFSNSTNEELIGLIRAVMNEDPRLIDLGYTDTEERRRLFLGEAMWEILTRLCPSLCTHPPDDPVGKCA